MVLWFLIWWVGWLSNPETKLLLNNELKSKALTYILYQCWFLMNSSLLIFHDCAEDCSKQTRPPLRSVQVTLFVLPWPLLSAKHRCHRHIGTSNTNRRGLSIKPAQSARFLPCGDSIRSHQFCSHPRHFSLIALHFMCEKQARLEVDHKALNRSLQIKHSTQ